MPGVSKRLVGIAAIVLFALPTVGRAAAPTGPAAEAERIVFLLQYVGTDYAVAVRDGQIIHRASMFGLMAVRRARAEGIPVHLVAHEDVLVLKKV